MDGTSELARREVRLGIAEGEEEEGEEIFRGGVM
jgi:hypothetical protein